MSETPPFANGPIAPALHASFVRRLSRRRRTGDALWLREFTERGHFERTIPCYAGCVTIIAAETFRAFKDAVSEARLESKPLDLRYGDELLDASEIAFSEPALWRQGTVKEVLKASGVPEKDLAAIVSCVKLDPDALPRSLDAASVKNLSFLVTLYSRSRVIALDAPFDGLTAEQADYLGTLVLDRIAGLRQVCVVSVPSKTPSSWRGSRDVRSEIAPSLLQRIFPRFIRRYRRELDLQKVKALQVSSIPEAQTPDPVVVTSPQAVPKQRARAEVIDGIKAETIQNPLVEGQEEFKNTETLPRRTPSGTMRRKRSLTRVSAIMRVTRKLGLIDYFQAAKRALFEDIESAQQASLSTEAKLRSARRLRKIKLVQKALFILCAALLIFCALR